MLTEIKNTAAQAQHFGAFTDSTVRLVRPNDARCARLWGSDAAGCEQGEDGPRLVVVGRDASEASLQALATRLRVEVRQLLAFRDSP